MERQVKKIIDFNGTCFVFQYELEPGDFTIPFEFVLPAKIPGSVMFRDDTMRESPRAEVKYYIKSIITYKDNDLEPVIFRSLLKVLEQPSEDSKSYIVPKTITTSRFLGCLMKGETTVSLYMKKKIYFTNDELDIDVIIDNKNCQYDIDLVQVELIQQLSLMRDLDVEIWEFEDPDRPIEEIKPIGYRYYQHYIKKRKIFRYNDEYTIMIQNNSNTVHSLEENIAHRTFDFNLKAIKYEVDPLRSAPKPGWFTGYIQVQRPPDEVFMLERMAPSCMSLNIKNQYVIRVVLTFDGTFYKFRKTVEFPVQIGPEIDMDRY